MRFEKPVRMSHLLFDFIGWTDYRANQNLPRNELERLRTDFIDAIWNNPIEELELFCNEVIRLQQYRYSLNGAAGVETKEWIPKGMENDFIPVPFDPRASIQKLKKTSYNSNDPGIILQDCLGSDDLQKELSLKLSQMSDVLLIYFSQMIDALEWFSDSQTRFWFTYHPERIPERLKDHFWFIDENYLGEKEFLLQES